MRDPIEAAPFVRKLGAFGVAAALSVVLAGCASQGGSQEPEPEAPVEETEAVEEEPVVEEMGENAGSYPVVSGDEYHPQVYSLNYFENDEPVFPDGIKDGWRFAGAYAEGKVAVMATQGTYDESWGQWDSLEPVVEFIDRDGNVLCNLNELVAQPGLEIVSFSGLGYTNDDGGGDARIQFRNGSLALEVTYEPESGSGSNEAINYLIDEDFQIVYQSSEGSIRTLGVASPYWKTSSGIIDGTGAVLLTSDDVAQQSGLEDGINDPDVQIKGSHYLAAGYQGKDETAVLDFEGNVLFASSALNADLEYDSAEFELNADDRTVGVELRKNGDVRIGLYDYVGGEWVVELEDPEDTGIAGFTTLGGQTFKLVNSGNPNDDLYTLDGALVAENVFWQERNVYYQGGECYLLSSGMSSAINLLDLENMTAREFPYNFTPGSDDNPWDSSLMADTAEDTPKFVEGTADYASDEEPITASEE